MRAIAAGFLIAMGGIVNLTVGGVWGAIFFSLGLMTIITFKFDLFTGKAGLWATNDIDFIPLMKIWYGNFIGTLVCAVGILLTPAGLALQEKAASIVALRTDQTATENFILGIFCGLLMYIADFGFQKTKNYLFCIAPVAFFILCGFNHCVADMFYVFVGGGQASDLLCLIPTTFGNIVGCNLIPIINRMESRQP